MLMPQEVSFPVHAVDAFAPRYNAGGVGGELEAGDFVLRAAFPERILCMHYDNQRTKDTQDGHTVFQGDHRASKYFVNNIINTYIFLRPGIALCMYGPGCMIEEIMAGLFHL
jgi:hypothetical protein